jgi:hypothetical protein
MPQADGVHKLRRIEFEYMGKAYKFALNPEEYNQSEPSRTTITQTKTSAWVDDFGAGIPTIQFKGTTGFRSKEMRNYLDNANVTDNNQQRWLENILRDTKGQYTTEKKIWARDKLESTLTGFLKFKELRDLMRNYYNKVPSGQAIPASKELIFHNYTDEDHWVVYPEKFDLLRSVSRPLMYLYDIKLVCIRKADVPHPDGVNGDNLAASLTKFKLDKYGLRGER